MTWIDIIEPSEATGSLNQLYKRVQGPDGIVDNILKAHSLRPHMLLGHMTLYKNVLHHKENTLPKWYLECIGVYVSALNNCHYCVAHHFEGLAKLLDNREQASALRSAMTRHHFEDVLAPKLAAGMHYARQLTESPEQIQQLSVQVLRDVGLSDGEILEINQVVAYFAYANRTVLGLGITVQGDTLGLSPADNNDADNWSHE